ncbi:MAG: AMP-binding protein [Deltaproteobacteria bacterium]|nr:AMP-binding protein [Deltaproteobacteria bacterium]
MEFTGTLQTLITALARYDEQTAVVALQRGSVETWSFRQIVNAARRLAAGLVKAGLPQGAQVLVYAPNSPEWIIACFALLIAAAVPVVIDAQLGDDDLRHVLNDSGARWGFTTVTLARRLTEAWRGASMTLVLFDADKDDPRSWRRYQTDVVDQFPAAHPPDLAVLFYTSGTTGAPKGVPLSHANLTSNLQALAALQLIKDSDRFLLPLPLHHVYPFTIGMLAPLTVGAAVIFPRSLTGPQIVRALHAAQATVIVGVPRFYAALVAAMESRVQQRGRIATAIFQRALALSIALRRRLGVSLGQYLFAPLHKQFAPRLRIVVSGGAAIEPELVWKLEGLGWQTTSGYGLTETSPLLTFNPPGTGRIGAVGRPLPDVQLRIAAPEEHCQFGEVQAKGPNVFAGYRNLPEKTQESFTADGYFRTGDLGYFDADGYLYIVGRASAMIVMPTGENVWPEDVEATLLQNERVREAGVFAHGGRLAALVVPEEDILHLPPEEVQEAMRAAVEQQLYRLPSHHRITEYAITSDPLPRTHLGKIRRHQLAARYTQAKQQGYQPPTAAGPTPISEFTPDDQHLLEDHTALVVWEWLSPRFPRARITPDTHLQLDLDVDSLAWLHLTLELRERAGVNLTEEAISRIETVRDLLRESIEAEHVSIAGPSPLELLQHSEALLSATQQQWLQPPGPLVRLLGVVLSHLNRAVMRWIFKLEVRGLDHLPQHRAFILTPNHVSLLDPQALAAALPEAYRAHTYWGGWTGIMFTSRLMRLVSRAACVVPVDSEKGPLSSLAFGVAALTQGANLVWFPEGGISRTGKLQRFRPGIGLVAQVRSAPIVPVWIAGTSEALPYGQRWPRRRQVTITFGSPVDPEELRQGGKGVEAHERIVDALFSRVAALAGV